MLSMITVEDTAKPSKSRSRVAVGAAGEPAAGDHEPSRLHELALIERARRAVREGADGGTAQDRAQAASTTRAADLIIVSLRCLSSERHCSLRAAGGRVNG